MPNESTTLHLLAPVRTLDRRVVLVRLWLLHVRIGLGRRATRRADEGAQLMRTVVETVAIQIVEPECLVVGSPGVQRAEGVCVVVVVTAVEPLEDRIALPADVVTHADARRERVAGDDVALRKRLGLEHRLAN